MKIEKSFKHVQNMVALMLITFMGISTVACSSDDEDEPKKNSIAGTSWTVLSDIDNTYGDEEDGLEPGTIIEFKKDGNVSFIPNTESWGYAKWSMNGNTLKIELGEEEPDDYIEGSFTIEGDKATYKYSWYDCDGEWGGDEHYTMTLQKN